MVITMKRFTLILFLLTFFLGFGVSCVVDLDPNLEGVYFCESDDDCTNRFQCDLEENRCVRPRTDNPTFNQNQPNTEIESCDELDEDEYPIEGGLPHLQEICDGIDNNCDGEIDVIYCERNSDCPTGTLARDPEGNSVRYECNTTLGVCEAYAFNTLQPGCSEPIRCIDGALEIVPEQCR